MAEEDAAITFQWSNNKDHILRRLQQGRGGRSDYISMITFYSDYSKAEVDVVITFQWTNNKDHILQWLQQGRGGRGDYISMIK